MLVLQHPEVAYRDCQMCQQWLYEESGARAVRPVNNEPIRRPPGVSTACRTPAGCPKGTPESQLSFTPQNRKCYEHYLRAKATGRFPDDPLVAQHAGLIRGVEEAAERLRHLELVRALMKRG